MKITRAVFILASICTFLFNCKKKEDSAPPPDPDPYTYNAEQQSSKDISFATYLISDLDMIIGFIGENQNPLFYEAIPGSSTQTLTWVHDSQAHYIFGAFDNVNCVDGKKRNGTLVFNYGNNGLGASNYHDYGFAGNLTLPSLYLVDGWKIELFDAAVPATIGNLVSSANYEPAHTNLSWKIQGKFRLLHPTDPGRNIIWDGTLVKTLINTADTLVFSPSKTKPINWNLAKVQYTGTVTGTTGQTVNFNYLVDGNKPLIRDFNCAFTPAGSIGVTEFHPFINGVATFTTANYHPRTIDYGPQSACDNSGTISFKGETYNVNFE